NYDDPDYIAENDAIAGGFSVRGVMWAFTDTERTSNWHPLTFLSHMMDAQLASGDLARAATVSHVHNVLLHAANATLLFLVILALFPRPPIPNPQSLIIPALLALFWAVHPLRAEVVCWVSERKELLSVFLMLLSLLFYRGERMVASLVLYALALMAKPVAVGFPAILFVLEYPRRLRRVVPFAALAVAECLVTVFAQQGAMDRVTAFPERVVTAVAAIGTYARQTVWPSGLHILYRLGLPTDWAMVAIGAVILLAAGWASWRFLVRRKSPNAALAVAWCLVCLVPMLGIVQVGQQSHADRYTYWIGCGLSVALAALLSNLNPQSLIPHPTSLISLSLAAAVVALSAVAWPVSMFWHDTVRLYSRVAEVDPDHHLALSSLAQESMRTGDIDRAIGFFRRAVAADSSDADVSGQFALALAGRGSPADIEELRRLVAPVMANPSVDTFGHALEAIGIVAMRGQDWNSAAEWFALARRHGKISAQSDDCAMRLAMCFYNAKRWRESAAELTKLAASQRSEIVAKARELLGYIKAKGGQ
ncbi:MAG: DUF2029 domain-containing protein, partial [Kiritimatiellae bacterium]|nr:DUF2029 domain-containing protein [Kiritimatiellia bacterium]